MMMTLMQSDPEYRMSSARWPLGIAFALILRGN
jgi:hypothetical protein